MGKDCQRFCNQKRGTNFAALRLRKSEMELKFLQHAIDITTEAQERAWSGPERQVGI